MSREDLMKMKVDELRKYASSVGVKNSHGYKKAELVEAILAAETSAQSSNKDAEVEQQVDNRNERESNAEEMSAGKSENDAVNVVSVEVDMEKKMPYIENAPIGAIVAFKMPGTGVLKSAKIINRSTKKRKLKLETVYKKQIVVKYDDIVWVRSGFRWPTGIFKALKEGVRYVEDYKQ